jgi:hypothetical protein
MGRGIVLQEVTAQFSYILYRIVSGLTEGSRRNLVSSKNMGTRILRALTAYQIPNFRLYKGTSLGLLKHQYLLFWPFIFSFNGNRASYEKKKHELRIKKSIDYRYRFASQSRRNNCMALILLGCSSKRFVNL